MRLTSLKERIEREDYAVDPHAVAEALMRHARTGVGLFALPPHVFSPQGAHTPAGRSAPRQS